ncbi:helix-turn-helix protein [Micromonospora pisi]|uniref:Helix-turn-helix protein n=1 Tax=Micromonospora pisi TaxID=589240 RepID=A0A495JHQ7_9ACTN|nr:helix-turn-helix transcriptional regulator [Micromonospora pisi]RKR88423.1 helix-turn-helix protein [Micromonospora pisi]
MARRRLSRTLKRLREDRRYTINQVQRAMEWSTSKVVRIESGAVGITVNDLRVLLAYYGLHDDETVEALLHLSRASKRHHWAAQYRPVLPAAYIDFLGYEMEATLGSYWEPLFIPTLLQTEEYAEVLIKATAAQHLPMPEVEARVRLNNERQRRVLTPERAGATRIIIDESALVRCVGDEDVMRRQFAHLDVMIERTRAEIVVAPLAVGAHLGLDSSFSILEHAASDDPDMVHRHGGPQDALEVEDPRVVQQHKETFDGLASAAIRGDNVRRLLVRPGQ